MGVLEPLEVGKGDLSEPLESLGWLPLGDMAGLELLLLKRRMAAFTSSAVDAGGEQWAQLQFSGGE